MMHRRSSNGSRSRGARILVVGTILAGLVQISGSSPATASHPAPAGLDHFKCYDSVGITTDPYEFPRGQVAQLTDQFGTFQTDIVKTPNRLCNPVEKILPTGQSFAPQNPRAHLVCFQVFNTTFQPKQVRVENQFGTALLTVNNPNRLCVPTWKNFTGQFPLAEEPPGLDHFVCYKTAYTPSATGAPIDAFEEVPPSVTLKDQFLSANSQVLAPKELCNPARKQIGPTHSVGISNPAAHQVCFRITHPTFTPRKPFTKNQFGLARVKANLPSRLCLPSFKQVV